MTKPPHNSVTHDAIIFGGGLAGTILAERFLNAGKQILLVNDPQKSRCSRVAAGLINPIGGKRLKLIWEANTLIPHAKEYYSHLAEEFGMTFFHPRPIRREFANEQESSIWQKRLDDPAHQRWVDYSADDHFTLSDAGYLDTNALLDSLHSSYDSNLLSSSFSYEEIESNESGVQFRDFQANLAIFAEGHLATDNPHFQFVPYKPAKGIIATIKLPSGTRDLIPGTHIIIKSKFIVPRHDGTIQVGATYNWDDATDEPDEKGIEEIRSFLDEYLGTDNWSFDQIQAGVRPATAGAYPVVGRHPEKPQLIAFNGFGSKGSLQIPYFAQQLVAHLDFATPLPAEVLPSRFVKEKKQKPKRWIATDIAKAKVLQHLSLGGIAVDATAGNGHDTLWLAETVGANGHVFAFDIQEQALSTTRKRLEANQLGEHVSLLHTGHENLKSSIPSDQHGQISAIIYNLGFLPGGDPTLITKSDTTILALKSSLQLLKPGGILSITLYPAHSGAQEEVNLVLSWLNNLDPDKFDTRIEHHPQRNPHSPYPAFVTKQA